MQRLVNHLMTPEAATAFAISSPQALPVPMMGEPNQQLNTRNWFWNRSTGAQLRLSVPQWLHGLCTQPEQDKIQNRYQ